MLIRVPSSSRALESEVTPESVYLSRRKLMQGSLALAALGAMPGWARADAQGVYADVEPAKAPGWFDEKLARARWQAVVAEGENITPFRGATHYNNFYEFGTGKGDPAANAGKLQVEPWTVTVDGEVGKPGATPSRIWSSRMPLRNVSTGCAASRRGPWSFLAGFSSGGFAQAGRANLCSALRALRNTGRS
jgi:hypothetical protein